jgi:hypothetical protein
MTNCKRLVQAGVLAAAVSLAIMGPGAAVASAATTGQRHGHTESTIAVAGHFQTADNPACSVPSSDCITDQLTGSFIGRNELTTKDFTQTSTVITYHDQTVITVNGGAFAGKQYAGNEHGKISINSGHFHSCAEFTATDGSGDTLIMRYRGFIDLANNHDNGSYVGAINSHEHCPPVS